MEGIPPVESAGNVLLPYTSLQSASESRRRAITRRRWTALRTALTDDPPYGAHVTFADAIRAPDGTRHRSRPWLQNALDDASTANFGNVSRAFGEGGSIPFMGMFGEMFPDAQFVITGVLGPGTNAHGPNEYLHLPTARRITVASRPARRSRN